MPSEIVQPRNEDGVVADRSIMVVPVAGLLPAQATPDIPKLPWWLEWVVLACVLVVRRRRLLLVGAAATVLAMIILVFSMWLMPRQISFSFARANNCIIAPVFLPGLYTNDPKAAVRVTRPAVIAVFGRPLVATQACVVPVRPIPANGTLEVKQTVRMWNISLASVMRISTGSYAAARPAVANTNAVSLLDPLRFSLNQADELFDYSLNVNGQIVACAKQGAVVACNLNPLHLAYGTPYRFMLMRGFRGQSAGAALTLDVQTITAVAIISSSITPGATVYDAPTQVVLTTSKPLKSVEGMTVSSSLNGAVSDVPSKLSISDTTLTVRFLAALPRRATTTVHIAQVLATDRSQLEGPYDLTFTTSGGPRVIGANLPRSGASLRPTVAIYFDQPLAGNQSAAELVSLRVNGAAQTAAAAISGSQLILNLPNELPRCALLTVQTVSNIQSNYGFSGDAAWSYTARTLCYTTFSIGASVRGRPITAYQFGPGGNMVLYIAAMHGSESNTATLLSKWIDELDAYPDKIPAGRTIVVIPQINPDGVAARTRENAHTIDLNRNFPANNWQTQVTEPGGGGVITNEGGPSPLSEPESQAIAAYVQAQQPRLVLTYHSYAAVVEANDAADSDAIGASYAKLAGYQAIPTYAIGNTFDYSTTGAFEDWMRDKLGWPALLVELRTTTYDEFPANRAAMWAMAQL